MNRMTQPYFIDPLDPLTQRQLCRKPLAVSDGQIMQTKLTERNSTSTGEDCLKRL